MHPRGDMSRHYVVYGLVRAGYAVFASNSRYLNNDHDCLHERILLDIAAGQRMLHERGYEGLALFGNSGGGSLFAFYQAQASAPPPDRLRDIPGDPGLDLGRDELPPADAYISIASHRGQGMFMLGAIDPAVVDEDDPTLTNPAPDMFNPDNGYRPLPKPSAYSAEFIARYREGPRARVARLDARAHGYLDRQRAARDAQRAADFAADPLVGNYSTATALGRVMTPCGWLSTWSGLSSRANLTGNLRSVRVPMLIVNAHGDSDIFPADARAIFEAAAADDKQFVSLERAGHYLTPVPGSTGPEPRERLIEILVPWLRERLP